MIKRSKNYFEKGVLLLSILLIMLLSCTNDDLRLSENNQIQQKKNSIRKVTIKEVPLVEKYLKSNISSNQKSSSNSSYAVTPFGNISLDNITEVLDTLGNANYTFPIIPSNLQKDKFFNLIIHQNIEQGTSSSYVVEYKMESDFAVGYANGTKDFNQFTGKIKKYSTETFLANPPPTAPCTEDSDDDNEDDLPPCFEIEIIDGNDYNDTGNESVGNETNTSSNSNEGTGGDSSSDGASSSIGGSGAVTCWTELIATPCTGNAMHYGESYCQGSFQGSILLVTTCSDGYGYTIDVSHKTQGDCDDGNGDIAVVPTIFSEFDTIVLGLNEVEQECLNQNCDLKNDLYQYLNNHVDTNGNYEQDAVDFTQSVTELIDSSCSFNAEVDFEDQIIIELEFLNNECLSDVYSDMKDNSTSFKDYLQNFMGEVPVSHLRFKYDENFENTFSPEYHDALAITESPQNYMIDITFNGDPNLDSSIHNKPKLIIAVAFIHEMIHAEIFRKLLSVAHLPNVNYENYSEQEWNNFINDLRNDFPGLFDYFVRYKYNEVNGQLVIINGPTDEQHQQMAQHYVNIIKNAIAEYDNNAHSQETYEAIAWMGLYDTTAWNNLTQEEQTTLTTNINNFIQNDTDTCN